MGFLKRHWLELTSFILIGLFIFLRFFKLESTFFFIGDQGRDMLVLWDWKTTGKPPLLGPQTSAMPMNQSAVYFYLLYPLFLLFNGSPVSSIYTNTAIYILCFVVGLVLLNKHKKLQNSLLVLFFLSSIHPQYIVQNKYIWNPSFLPPLLSVAFITLYLLTEKFSIRRLVLFSSAMALSVSLHFPAAAFMLASIFYILIFWKKKGLISIISLIGFFVFFNLPTLAFEVRHDFLITKSVFGQQWRGTEQFTMNENVGLMADFTFSVNNPPASLLLLAITLTYCVYISIKKPRNFDGSVGFIFLVSFAITILSKMAFHSHYIFGFTTILFILISSLGKFFRIPVLIALMLMYLNPSVLEKNYKESPRSIEEMTICFEKLCSENPQPMFVAVQAGFHPFHDAMEHRFLLKKAGCSIESFEQPTQRVDKMVVVLDDSTFELGKTGFNELTMFGAAKEVNKYHCQSNFGAVILSH